MASATVISERVAALATEIRELKASLASDGVAKDAINRHETVLSKVSELQTLKKQLDSNDPSRDEVILARLADERRQRHLQEQAAAEAQQIERKAVETAVAKPLVQRKIFHLFCHAGNGETFHYEPPPRLNALQTGFGEGVDPHPRVYVTEKWDGTTMQATSTHIFKRIDLWGKRKKGDPSERYDLRLVGWRGEKGAWYGLDFADAEPNISQAVSPYLSKFELLDDGLCVYFEVVHTNINSTFKHLQEFADIRVFDFSRTSSSTLQDSSTPAWQGFLPFEEAVQFSERFGLPIVGWEQKACLDTDDLWHELLLAARGRHYSTVAAQIEGFVVREAGAGGRIAKARVEHVPARSTESVPAAQFPNVALWDRQALSRSHFASIGLPVINVSS